MQYAKIEPINRAIKASRQVAKRHYGVHPYFTRRPPNVVRAYIEHYSLLGDRVLDPFGGSGVTAIEAFLSGRYGIHNDINPLGNFIAQQVADVSRDNADYIKQGLRAVDSNCGDVVRSIPRMSAKELERELHCAPLPENIELPKNADVDRFYDLFTPIQLLSLAVLKQSIDDLEDEGAKGQLLLAWSATVAKLNRTFLSAKGRAESRGGSSIFSIYRYKVARRPVELPPWGTFVERVMNVIKAKEEVLKEKRYLEPKGLWRGKFECHSRDVLELQGVVEPVDYIFTDPPYGGHITYLDLSTIWNHWLGFRVSMEARKNEIIVGGEMGKSKDEYLDRLRKSIKVCVRLLKPNRWLSIVFQHWNIAYFEAILEAAEESGASLRSTVTQVGDTIWSMHKKKNLERVLAGEMILTFFKEGARRSKGNIGRSRRAKGNEVPIYQLVDHVLPSLAASKGVLHGEELFNRLITEAWKEHALHTLRISRDEFLDLLEQRGWYYDPKTHCWTRRRAIPQSEGQLAF